MPQNILPAGDTLSWSATIGTPRGARPDSLDGDTLVFVGVKTLTSNVYGAPELTVDRRKQERMEANEKQAGFFAMAGGF